MSGYAVAAKVISFLPRRIVVEPIMLPPE